MNLHQVIKGQVTTEKSVGLQEKGYYAFFVHSEATKIDIKNAFKEFWGAEVATVRLARLPKKTRLVSKGKEKTKRSEKTKAYVSFKKGSSFEILKFSGAKKAVKKDEVKKEEKTAKKSAEPKKAVKKDTKETKK